MMSPFSWVSVGGAAPLTNLLPRRDITLTDVLLDEGAYNALSVRPDLFPVANGGAISLVYLSQLYVNVTNLGEVGVRIHQAENVLIENSHFGWSHNSIGAMELAYVNNAILNRSDFSQRRHDHINNNVTEVSVINSVYQHSSRPSYQNDYTADPADGPPVRQQSIDIWATPDIPLCLLDQQQARCGGALCASNEGVAGYPASGPAPPSYRVSCWTPTVSGKRLPFPRQHAQVGRTRTKAVHVFGLATSGQYDHAIKAFYTFKGTMAQHETSFVTPPEPDSDFWDLARIDPGDQRLDAHHRGVTIN
jgi:hypothetical protein